MADPILYSIPICIVRVPVREHTRPVHNNADQEPKWMDKDRLGRDKDAVQSVSYLSIHSSWTCSV